MTSVKWRICFDGAKMLPGTSRSWPTTKDDDMSIKREDVDASRVDFADVGTGKAL